MCPAFPDGGRGFGDGRDSCGRYPFGGLKCIGEFVVQARGDSLPTKNLGEVIFFLGCAFRRDREAGTIEISQESYIRSVLERFKICRTSSIPASPVRLDRVSNDGYKSCRGLRM